MKKQAKIDGKMRRIEKERRIWEEVVYNKRREKENLMRLASGNVNCCTLIIHMGMSGEEIILNNLSCVLTYEEARLLVVNKHNENKFTRDSNSSDVRLLSSLLSFRSELDHEVELFKQDTAFVFSSNPNGKDTAFVFSSNPNGNLYLTNNHTVSDTITDEIQLVSELEVRVLVIAKPELVENGATKWLRPSGDDVKLQEVDVIPSFQHAYEEFSRCNTTMYQRVNWFGSTTMILQKLTFPIGYFDTQKLTFPIGYFDTNPPLLQFYLPFNTLKLLAETIYLSNDEVLGRGKYTDDVRYGRINEEEEDHDEAEIHGGEGIDLVEIAGNSTIKDDCSENSDPGNSKIPDGKGPQPFLPVFPIILRAMKLCRIILEKVEELNNLNLNNIGSDYHSTNFSLHLLSSGEDLDEYLRPFHGAAGFDEDGSDNEEEQSTQGPNKLRLKTLIDPGRAKILGEIIKEYEKCLEETLWKRVDLKYRRHLAIPLFYNAVRVGDLAFLQDLLTKREELDIITPEKLFSIESRREHSLSESNLIELAIGSENIRILELILSKEVMGIDSEKDIKPRPKGFTSYNRSIFGYGNWVLKLKSLFGCRAYRNGRRISDRIYKIIKNIVERITIGTNTISYHGQLNDNSLNTVSGTSESEFLQWCQLLLFHPLCTTSFLRAPKFLENSSRNGTLLNWVVHQSRMSEGQEYCEDPIFKTTNFKDLKCSKNDIDLIRMILHHPNCDKTIVPGEPIKSEKSSSEGEGVRKYEISLQIIDEDTDDITIVKTGVLELLLGIENVMEDMSEYVWQVGYTDNKKFEKDVYRVVGRNKDDVFSVKKKSDWCLIGNSNVDFTKSDNKNGFSGISSIPFVFPTENKFSAPLEALLWQSSVVILVHPYDCLEAWWTWVKSKKESILDSSTSINDLKLIKPEKSELVHVRSILKNISRCAIYPEMLEIFLEDNPKSGEKSKLLESEHNRKLLLWIADIWRVKLEVSEFYDDNLPSDIGFRKRLGANSIDNDFKWNLKEGIRIIEKYVGSSTE